MATYFELAHMANNVYGYDYSYLKNHIPSWFPLKQTASSSSKFNDTSRSGFFACIYQNFSTKECVLAVKGTNFLSEDDLISDAKFGLDSLFMRKYFLPELKELQKYMYLMQVHYPEYKYTTLTGHSLGGILSKLGSASTLTDKLEPVVNKVLAFNSSGVSAALNNMGFNPIICHPKKIETIITNGDDVGNLCKINDIGKYIEVVNIAASKNLRAAERVAAIGGGASTVALGSAGLGAAIGSVVLPGIGTLIGGVVGALGGGVAGGVAGYAGIEYLEHSMDNLIKSMNQDCHYNFNQKF